MKLKIYKEHEVKCSELRNNSIIIIINKIMLLVLLFLECINGIYFLMSYYYYLKLKINKEKIENQFCY